MKNKISNLSKREEIDVIVDVDGQKLSGKLHIGGSIYPVFTLKNRYSHEAVTFLSFMSEKESLICVSISDGTIFSLNEVTIDDLAVTAKYLTLGKQLQQYNKFQVRLTGISVWIEGTRGFNFNDNVLERSFNTETFSEQFRFGSENYILSNDYHIQTNNRTPVESCVSIEHTLVVYKKEGYFSFSECESVSHELRNLFSLLIGASLSVSKVWIYKDDEPHKYQWLYFPTALYAQEPLRHESEALIRFTNITQESKWGTILDNYFNKDIFRNIWNRIVPSYGRVGIWEYDILSRVVTLEMYAAVKTSSNKLSLKKSLNSAFMKEIDKTINEFRSSMALSGDDLLVFDGMAKSIKQTRNTSLPTLREKFDELMLGITPALRNAVSFTDDDFIRIKKIRDSTAHGLDYVRQNPGNDITHETQLSDRLLVLLMCFVYLELGFTESEIASFLRFSQCGFISGADINKRELDMLSGQVLFVKLTQPPKNIVLENYKMIALCHSVELDTWCLHEEITQKIQTEWHSSGMVKLIDYVESIIPKDNSNTLELQSQVYVESAGNETEHFSSVIIHS